MKYFENWRKFQNQAEKQTLYEEVLNEISDENYSRIKDWLADQGDEALPFNKLFNGKMRTSISLGSAISPTSGVGKIIRYLDDNGWKADIGTGLATREASAPDLNIPAPVRRVTGVGAGQPRTEKQKIGKLLAKALRLGQRTQEAYNKRYKFHQEHIAPIPFGDQETRDKIIKSKEYRDLQDKEDTTEQTLQKTFPSMRKSTGLHQLNSMIDFWNKKSQFYRENPDSAGIEYSIIISRHPIDVVRMSDFAVIHSCHSEGSDYFHCAMGEARGHGPIAYVVATKDLEGVNLDDEEIFEDDARDIEGIEPISRIRLRRFHKSDHKYDLAIPEIRTYGVDIPGFYTKLRSWALENQPQFKEAVNDEGAIDPEYMRKFTRTGGSYSDSQASKLFNKFFMKFQPLFTGDVTEDSDDEGPDQHEELWNEYTEGAAEVERRADLEHCWVNYDVEEGDEGYPYVSFHGGVNIIFSKDLFIEEIPASYEEKKVLYHDIDEALEDEFGDLQVEDTAINTLGDTVDITIQFDPYAQDYYDSSPEGFESFVEDIEKVEADYSNIRRKIKSVFASLGYAEPTATDVLVIRLEDDGLELKHFTEIDKTEGDVKISLGTERYLSKYGLGPVKNTEQDEFFKMVQNMYEDGQIINNRFIQSTQFTNDLINQFQKELKASVDAANRQLELFGKGEKQIELPLHVDPVTPDYLKDYITDNIRIHLIPPSLRDIDVGSPLPRIPHKHGPMATKAPRHAQIQDIKFFFDEQIDPATMHAAINFLQHIDKNLEKFVEKASDMIRVADVAYSKKYVEGRAGQQTKIDAIFKMIDVMQKVEIEDLRGKTVGEVPDSLVNQLETLMTSIDVKSAILNNDYSKLNKKKVKALQELLPKIVGIYRRFKNLGRVEGEIPDKQLTLEKKVRTMIYKALRLIEERKKEKNIC